MSKIRVLHLITELNIGGAEKALARLLAHLNRDRFTPTVACLYGGDSPIANEVRALDIPVLDLGMTAKWRWDALWRLYHLLRREHPMILHTWMIHANVVGRVLGQMVGVPIIITSRRNVNIGGNAREYINRWTASLGDRAIAVCELARQVEIERTGVPSEHVVTIYNGVDVGQFSDSSPQSAAQILKTFGIPTDAPLVGSVGRFRPQKGYADLLVAMKQVKENAPNARLLLVGGGELQADLEAKVLSLGLDGVVTFAGIRADVPEILAVLDVFVLSSLWEGMPNAILEAMAAGLPVVATAVGGTPDVVVDGVTGFLVPPRDPSALAKALATLVRDPDLRRRMGQAGRERVLQHFSVERMVERTQNLYEQLLSAKGL
jgi:sugar transferase (PEP-CTERM/EpsH1 system associated)